MGDPEFQGVQQIDPTQSKRGQRREPCVSVVWTSVLSFHAGLPRPAKASFCTAAALKEMLSTRSPPLCCTFASQFTTKPVPEGSGIFRNKSFWSYAMRPSVQLAPGSGASGEDR